jgi:hypothetical protein
MKRKWKRKERKFLRMVSVSVLELESVCCERKARKEKSVI